MMSRCLLCTEELSEPLLKENELTGRLTHGQRTPEMKMPVMGPMTMPITFRLIWKMDSLDSSEIKKATPMLISPKSRP